MSKAGSAVFRDDTKSKIHKRKKKMINWFILRLKISSVKDAIQRMKRLTVDLKKIFANYILDRDYI